MMPKGQFTLSPTAEMERILRGEIYKNLRLYKEVTGKDFNPGALKAKRGPKPGGAQGKKGATKTT
jgi:hypothetical protein